MTLTAAAHRALRSVTGAERGGGDEDDAPDAGADETAKAEDGGFDAYLGQIDSPIYRVAARNGSWMVIRDRDASPLVASHSKRDAMEAGRSVAREHHAKLVIHDIHGRPLRIFHYDD